MEFFPIFISSLQTIETFLLKKHPSPIVNLAPFLIAIRVLDLNAIFPEMSSFAFLEISILKNPLEIIWPLIFMFLKKNIFYNIVYI